MAFFLIKIQFYLSSLLNMSTNVLERFKNCSPEFCYFVVVVLNFSSLF